MKRFLGWCAARDMIDANPATAVEKVARETKRDRVLDDAELVTIWRAAEALGGIFGMAVRVLVLTGARRAEIFEARRGELVEQGAALRLPAERAKNGEGRLIWLVGAGAADRGRAARLWAGKLSVLVHRRQCVHRLGGGKERLDGAAARIAEQAELPMPLEAA